jgi:hypothetical protein
MLSERSRIYLLFIAGTSVPMEALARGSASRDLTLPILLLVVASVGYLGLAVRRSFPNLGPALGGLFLFALLSQVVAELLALFHLVEQEQVFAVFVGLLVAFLFLPSIYGWVKAKLRERLP